MNARCSWCGSDPLYITYHDTEWGVPERDSRALWEKLILDGFQAGLSWITILRKRDSFRTAFDGFNPEIVAQWGDAQIAACLANPDIVRHRGKIEAAVTNARAYLAIEESIGFASFLWRYVDGVPLQNRFASMAEVPAKTPLSAQIAKDLRQAGFKFCGPVITYAFMEAVGMVNDHIVTCPCHTRVAALGRENQPFG
ncbi:DNA-3-methyladenine glycosylase I [Phaeovulum sp.]|uniref:DNA-3-methyladenine glycosylase I n=1 Tax=Phaeovulum sp. TaxID=2934796 RepID=UPI0039E34F33